MVVFLSLVLFLIFPTFSLLFFHFFFPFLTCLAFSFSLPFPPFFLPCPFTPPPFLLFHPFISFSFSSFQLSISYLPFSFPASSIFSLPPLLPSLFLVYFSTPFLYLSEDKDDSTASLSLSACYLFLPFLKAALHQFLLAFVKGYLPH